MPTGICYHVSITSEQDIDSQKLTWYTIVPVLANIDTKKSKKMATFFVPEVQYITVYRSLILEVIFQFFSENLLTLVSKYLTDVPCFKSYP